MPFVAQNCWTLLSENQFNPACCSLKISITSLFPLLFNKLLHITSSDYLFHPHHFEGPAKTCASCILWLQKLLTKNYLTKCLVDLPHQPPRHHPCPRFLQTSPPDLCERWYFLVFFPDKMENSRRISFFVFWY